MSAATEGGDIIRLEALGKSYRLGGGTLQALDGISLALAPGSYWAVMGPSGSGKSTLLNLLGCLDRPSSGRYLLDGRDLSRLGDDGLSEMRLRYLGFVFQSFHLIPQMTVRENIELPLFYLDWEPARSARRAAELAQRVGLAGRLDHRPSQLSGGEQQRVAIARALANDPRILLADEPTGNLDSATGRQILALLGELNARGKTVVLVTHDPAVAEQAGCRLHLRDGRIDRIEGLG